MFKSAYHLCTVFGIPVKLDISLIILMFLLISNYGSPLYGIAAGVALLLSITLHELGHSLVAMAFGCQVRDITLMMIGGCATLLSMPRKAWQELLVAVAGPAVSLALAALCLLLPSLKSSSGNPLLPVTIGNFIFWQIGALNAMLFLFNLLPAFPMDGGRILRAFLQQFFTTKLRATWIASRIGKFIAFLMAVSVVFSLLAGSREGFKLIRLLIAYFVYQSAEREYRQVVMEEGSRGHSTAESYAFSSNPFDTPPPPSDPGTVVIGPPPYKRRGTSRADVHRK